MGHLWPLEARTSQNLELCQQQQQQQQYPSDAPTPGLVATAHEQDLPPAVPIGAPKKGPEHEQDLPPAVPLGSPQKGLEHEQDLWPAVPLGEPPKALPPPSHDLGLLASTKQAIKEVRKHEDVAAAVPSGSPVKKAPRTDTNEDAHVEDHWAPKP